MQGIVDLNDKIVGRHHFNRLHNFCVVFFQRIDLFRNRIQRNEHLILKLFLLERICLSKPKQLERDNSKK